MLEYKSTKLQVLEYFLLRYLLTVLLLVGIAV